MTARGFIVGWGMSIAMMACGSEVARHGRGNGEADVTDDAGEVTAAGDVIAEVAPDVPTGDADDAAEDATTPEDVADVTTAGDVTEDGADDTTPPDVADDTALDDGTTPPDVAEDVADDTTPPEDTTPPDVAEDTADDTAPPDVADDTVLVEDTAPDVEDVAEDTAPPDVVEDTAPPDVAPDVADDTVLVEDTTPDVAEDSADDSVPVDVDEDVDVPPDGPIGIVTWTVRTGADGAPDDVPGTRYCLAADRCATPGNALNWDDRDVRRMDVWHTHIPGLVRSDIDRVEITFPSADTWQIACVEVAIDGEVIHCAEGTALIGQGLPVWSTAPTVTCTSCWDDTLTQGPVVGATSDHDTRVWLRTDASRPVALRIATSPAALDVAIPIALAVPQAEHDFTHTFHVEGLAADTLYHYTLDVDGVRYPRGGAPPYRLRTAPPAGAPAAFSFGIASCGRSDPDKSPSQPTFDALDVLGPDLFLFAGDNVYFDPYSNGQITDLAGARAFYRDGLQRLFSWASPSHAAWADWGRDGRARFLSHTPTFAVWDDHDFLHDNSYGVSFGVPNPNRVWARQVFMEYWPNASYGEDGEGVYHRLAWGDVDVFMVDGRYFKDIDHTTILGDAQRTWLFLGLATSQATFKIVVDGSDWSTESVSDSWSGWPGERRLVWDWIAANDIEGVVFVSGDSHRSELRMLPGPDGGYTIPHLVSSGFATTRRVCPATNEFFAVGGVTSCYGADSNATPNFIVADVDTTLPDPRLVATIYDQGGNAQRSWTIDRSDLVLRGQVELARRDADFDRDGYADLAIGVPGEDTAGVDDGLVQVLLGSTAGLHSQGHKAFTQLGLSGSNESADRFGEALAHGDLDNDGDDDLVIGVPGEDNAGSGAASGRIVVLRGTPNGLIAGAESWSEDSAGVPGTGATEHRFGAALAVGDFDGDGRDDVAVGVPGDGGGAVQIFAGRGAALVPGIRLDQTNTGELSLDEPGDGFGAALAVGDFDGDGFDDLAIGGPQEDRDGASDAGLVTIVYGSVAGLGLDGAQADQELSAEDAQLVPRTDARLGTALAAGDLDGDGVDDLVVGAPGSASGAGRILVFLGALGDGLVRAGTSWTAEDLVSEVVGTINDALGSSLVVADFDGDGLDDIAAGAPGRSQARGAVFVLLSAVASQLLGEGDTTWSAAVAGNRFGQALAAGDYDADGYADLAVGTPGDTIGNAVGAGAVHVFHGQAGGLLAALPVVNRHVTQRWHQGLVNVNGTGSPEPGDAMGSVLGR